MSSFRRGGCWSPPNIEDPHPTLGQLVVSKTGGEGEAGNPGCGYPARPSAAKPRGVEADGASSYRLFVEHGMLKEIQDVGFVREAAAVHVSN